MYMFLYTHTNIYTHTEWNTRQLTGTIKSCSSLQLGWTRGYYIKKSESEGQIPCDQSHSPLIYRIVIGERNVMY